MDNQIEKNDEIEVTIERFGDNGEGIAVVDGKVLFVPFAVPGEVALVHIINDKHSFLIGKITQIIKGNNAKIVPKCPFFYKCGGCDLQHLPYKTQLELKKNIVRNALKKYADIDFEVSDVIPSSKEFRYRNKFAFPVQDDNGKIKIGMYRKNSHDVIEIDDCLLQSENTKLILKLFREYMLENKISAYSEKTHKGIIKHIVVREHEGKFILTVVVNDKKFNNFQPLIEKLKTQFSIFGIIKNVNLLQNNVIFGSFDEKIYGIDNLQFCDFDVEYEINNRSFLQVNDDIKNKIYQRVLDSLDEQNNIIDAYSGAGLLSSILAKKYKCVYGVEIESVATQNADNLKNKNNLYNLTNINGDCAKVIPELAKQLKGDFAIVVDPPRKGLDGAVTESFLTALPKQIIYISCNPATLARDLKKLVTKYDIEFVQPYDMFPQTANVETVVGLRKNRKIREK